MAFQNQTFCSDFEWILINDTTVVHTNLSGIHISFSDRLILSLRPELDPTLRSNFLVSENNF